MSPSEAKRRAIQIVEASYGDDLERAKYAFGPYSHEEMAQQHGQSGQTRQKILDDYQKDRDERRAVTEWLESLSV